MTLCSFLRISSLAAVGLTVGAFAQEVSLERYEQAQPHMGTQFSIALYAADEATARRAFAAAFARIAELDDRLSDYDATSELSRLSQAAPTPAPVPVSEDLWRLLVASQELSRRSEGAFDVTVGPLTQLWRRSRRQKMLPAPERLAAAKAAVGYQHLRLHEKDRTVELLQPHMRLDLGGIAKGYASDEALRAMAPLGVTRALVNGGGGLSLGEAPPGEQGWKVAVAALDPNDAPVQVLRLANCGVATAGDASQFVEIDGVRYSHIIDPRTGLGMTTRSSVTVVAPTGMQADALDTVAVLLGPDHGLRLIEETPGAAALFTWEENGQVRMRASTRYAELIKK